MTTNQYAFRKLIENLGGKFQDDHYINYAELNNKKSTGVIKNFQIFKGLHVITFDLKIHQDIVLESFYPNLSVLHFIFCSEGSFYQKFTNFKEEVYIARKQNIISSSVPDNELIIKLKEQSRLKFSIITFDKNGLNDFRSSTYDSPLKNMFINLVNSIKDDNPYRFYGNFSVKISSVVNQLIATKTSGICNRLKSESLVYQILAYQYEDHTFEHQKVSKKVKLTKKECETILELGDYLCLHLEQKHSVASLVRKSGLNEKKIQLGFMHFYGETLNKYIINLRILKAQELLEKTNKSISEIVFEIGLNSRSYFSSIFYKKLGVLPKEYRLLQKLSDPVYEVSYSSKAYDDLSREDLQNILKISQEGNQAKNISGCLIYHDMQFFQILEGPKSEVIKLIERIKTDKRHHSFKIVLEGYKSGRTFENWRLAFIENGNFLDEKRVDGADSINLNFLSVDYLKSRLTVKRMWERARNFLLYQDKSSVA